MSMVISGIPQRISRNGAKSKRWITNQAYDVKAAAKNPLTTTNIMLDISQHGTSIVIDILANNKGITVDVVRAIYANSPNESILNKLASNPATPSDILHTLGNSDYYRTGLKALRHANAPEVLLREKSPKASYDTLCTRGPHKGWRGSGRYYDPPQYKILMLHPNFPIDLFAESISFVSFQPLAKVLYATRGQELVDYLNFQHGLSLSYTDVGGIVRAVMKYLPH